MAAEDTSAPMKSLFRSPLAIALLAGAAIVAAAAALPLWHLLAGAPPPPVAEGLPWQVQRDGDSVRVFGLQLPGSTLADAQRQWGDGLQVAVMAQRGEPGALEAYVERYERAGIGGRLVLATALPPAQVQQLQLQAAKSAQVDADTARWWLRAEDIAATAGTPVVGITFIAAVQLDAATVLQRFGTPAERLQQGARLQHWLYPERGLAIVLDAEGREVLQFAAPADFEARLRAPLLKAGAVPAAGPPG